MRPLYSELTKAKLAHNHGNGGLYYDKFCDRWCLDPKAEGLAKWSLQAFQKKEGDQTVTVNPKLKWIDALTEQPVGDPICLEEVCDRQVRLLAAHGFEPLFFKTDWHFVTGLGREHPVENGFAWHHNVGVPYLPGSSVKGLVRAWAENWLDDKVRNTEISRIFGPRGEAALKSPACGAVIFLDALPTELVTLKADIMTPHYGPYYQDPVRNPPADWYSPTPIPFLVVAPETSFQFGLLPRRRGDEEDVEKVKGWLSQALDSIGAGAKTAVGYGRMKEDPDAKKKYQKRLKDIEQQRQEQQERDRWLQMIPEQRRIEELRRLFDDPATCMDDRRKQQMLRLREQLFKDALRKWISQTDRVAAADLIEAIYNNFGWGNDHKKQERQAAIAELRKPMSG